MVNATDWPVYFCNHHNLTFKNQAVVSLEQWEHGSVRPSVPVLQFHHRLVATSCRPATSPCSRPPCDRCHPSYPPLHPVLMPAARVSRGNDKHIWKFNIIQQRSSKSSLAGVFLVFLLILAVLGHRESIRCYKKASLYGLLVIRLPPNICKLPNPTIFVIDRPYNKSKLF